MAGRQTGKPSSSCRLGGGDGVGFIVSQVVNASVCDVCDQKPSTKVMSSPEVSGLSAVPQGHLQKVVLNTVFIS